MKKKSSSKSGFVNSRNLLAVLLCTVGVSLAMVSLAGQKPTTTTVRRQPAAHRPAAPVTPSAAAPTGGTLTSANIGAANAINWGDTVGSATNETFFAGMGTCAAPMSCSTFTLTIDPSVGTLDPTKYQIFIQLVWPQAAEDYDTFVCSTGGNCVQANVIASNTSTADPETITLPTTTAAGAYTINAVMATGAFEPYTGTVYIKPIPQTTGCTGNCTPPRYQNYPAGPGQADNAGEPSLGVDWNPNVAALKDTTSKTLTTGNTLLNTGGVAFFTSGPNEWRASFNDCASPAYNSRVLSISGTASPANNNWEDVSATFTQQSALSDPIGFVDHYSSNELGSGNTVHTPGRVFTIDLLGGQGNSAGSFSDDDGNSYLPGGMGGPGQGPDHETLGGGPYNPNSTPAPPPQPSPYPAVGTPNAIYYCSQNIVGEAQCSRSDNGGVSFGPGVPIFQNPAQCTGGIHGHVKVAPDGTVYVPNSSCGTAAGLSGVAVSTDNGLTWTENNVTGSFGGSQDPSVGVGQNNIGKVGTTNTIYLGYIDGGHAHIADSHDRGLNWEHNTDVGAVFGVTHAVFPVVVAGDDNRAAFGFVGTGDGINSGGTCDPYGTGNCANIWHLYIATTYDGGANWITVDATPNDPVQQGVVCLQGTLCSGGRNLLDFNDFAIDAEGRGLVAYADGCVNCDNTFQGQSSASHGTIARQSGGRRLFSHFDPIEPMPPAAPQMISANGQIGGAAVTWLEPDNGGSPITGYNVYRSGTSGTETFLAHVSGETTTKYLDPSPLSPASFYFVQAINGIGEGEHCGELALGNVVTVDPCLFPYTQVDPAGTAGNVPTDPTMGELTIQNVNIGEPFTNCADNSITFVMKVNTLDPSATGNVVLPPNGEWQILFGVKDTSGTTQNVYVEMDTFAPATPATPNVSYGRRDPCSAGCSTLDSSQTSTGVVSATTTKDGYIVFKLNVGTPLNFAAPGAPGTGSAFTWNASNPGTILGVGTKITGNTLLFVGAGAGFLETVQTTGGGTYTRVGNLSCVKVPPVARLTASPMSGVAPLPVTFDGSTSSDATPCGVTINSYTMDFGDGSAPVTQASPMFSHTYNSNGDYPAKLTVKDTLGQVSTNVAQVVISVESTLNRAQSVKTHGASGEQFVELPLVGSPRGVECRGTGFTNNYTIRYTFDRGLNNVDSATITQGMGTIDAANTGIGPAGNQYTVSLTGVPTAQYLEVTLNGVHDVAGAILNNAIARMGVLVGDVNANGKVTNADVASIQALVGTTTVNPTNFRNDVNANGRISNADVAITQAQVGQRIAQP